MTRAALVALGAYVCLVGALVHRHVLPAGGVEWPWGLLLVVTVTCLVAYAAGQVVRLGGAWFAGGWALALMAQQYSPGGSYLVASDWLGYAFIIGSLGGIVVMVLARPRLAR